MVKLETNKFLIVAKYNLNKPDSLANFQWWNYCGAAEVTGLIQELNSLRDMHRDQQNS